VEELIAANSMIRTQIYFDGSVVAGCERCGGQRAIATRFRRSSAGVRKFVRDGHAEGARRRMGDHVLLARDKRLASMGGGVPHHELAGRRPVLMDSTCTDAYI